jgi:hypothetical protein
MRVSSPLVARFGAVAAAAAIAMTGATAAASASTTHAKVATALSISESTPVVHPHQITAVVKGQLTAPNDANAPVSHKVVWLERQGPKGRWHLIRAEFTGRHGWVAFRVHVLKSGNFRLVFRGTPNFARSVSSAETVS